MVNKKRLLQTFLELVKIDSPSGEEEAMVVEMTKRLKKLGARVEKDSYGNVIAKFSSLQREENIEPIILNAHLDTVEPGRGIKPKVKGNKINSDGTTILGADDKAGLSIVLEALTCAVERKVSHPPFEVVLTLGEEAGLLGAMNLDYSKITARHGVSFDGHGPVSNVTISAPGYNRVDATIIGRSAHAGVEPEKGISAIAIAAHIISRLKTGRIDEETTANIGLIEGGQARNAVAERAQFKGEIRSRNVEKLEKHTHHFKEVFENVMANYDEAKLELEIKREFDPYHFGEDHPVIQKILAVFKKLKIKPSLEPTGGGSDVNIFNSHGIEIVDVGTGAYELHTTREYLNIKEFVEAAKFCYALIVEVENE
ncbi:M20/M25/M40 family metallo-hydrolase [Candidatus Microgenomates bacterium]|nr:M20/M25/M40 family metallo-hydrolase [Candidatus Microgenomates bacterium]